MGASETSVPTESDTRGLFISHSHDDAELVASLTNTITDLYAGYFSIFATVVKQIEGGDLWREAIRTNLAKSEVMLILITPNSLGSPWVPFEAGAAWHDSIEKRKTVIPCRFKTTDDFAKIVSDLQEVDLTNTASIRNILISALNRISRLSPSPRFMDEVLSRFSDEVSAISFPDKPLPTASVDFDKFVDLTVMFFKGDTSSAERYISMLVSNDLFTKDIQEQLLRRFDTTT